MTKMTSKSSRRWSERTRDVAASVSLASQLPSVKSTRDGVIETIADTCRFTKLPARVAYGARRRNNGGLCGGPTGGNGIDVVPQAFIR